MKELGLWLALSFAAILGIAVFDRWHQRKAMFEASKWAADRLKNMHKRPPPITSEELLKLIIECEANNREAFYFEGDNGPVDLQYLAKLINERMNACPRI